MVLSTRPGRAVVLDMLRLCHYGLSPFAENNNLTNMIAGKQKVGEAIMEMMNAVNHAAFFQMMKEAKEDEEYDNRDDTDTAAA